MPVGVEEVNAPDPVGTILDVGPDGSAPPRLDEQLRRRPGGAAVGRAEHGGIVIQVAREMIDAAALRRKLEWVGVGQACAGGGDRLLPAPVGGGDGIGGERTPEGE